jgi:hypothetical protein
VRVRVSKICTSKLYCFLHLYLSTFVSFVFSIIFIFDIFTFDIIQVNPNGFRCLVGYHGSGSQSTQLFFPSSFTFDRSGNIFVIDQKNNRIQKFEYLENSCGKLKIVE